MGSILDSMAVLMNGVFGRQMFVCVKEKYLILSFPGCEVITAHITKCFPYIFSFPWVNKEQKRSPSPGVADRGHSDLVISKSEVS